MAAPTVNAGGVGVTSTQHHEAKHKKWAHSAYAAAGKRFLGLHERMGSHLQRQASIDSIPDDQARCRQHDGRARARQSTSAECETKMVGEDLKVVLYEQGHRAHQACVCVHCLQAVFSVFCFLFSVFDVGFPFHVFL